MTMFSLPGVYEPCGLPSPVHNFKSSCVYARACVLGWKVNPGPTCWLGKCFMTELHLNLPAHTNTSANHLLENKTKQNFLGLFYLMCLFSLHVCMYIMCVVGARGGQKRSSGPLELVL